MKTLQVANMLQTWREKWRENGANKNDEIGTIIKQSVRWWYFIVGINNNKVIEILKYPTILSS